MKAPNKIYTDNRGVYAELPIFSQADANIEYIRKDALIEWLSKCKNNPTITDLQKDNIQELIDKIDSI